MVDADRQRQRTVHSNPIEKALIAVPYAKGGDANTILFFITFSVVTIDNMPQQGHSALPERMTLIRSDGS